MATKLVPVVTTDYFLVATALYIDFAVVRKIHYIHYLSILCSIYRSFLQRGVKEF